MLNQWTYTAWYSDTKLPALRISHEVLSHDQVLTFVSDRSDQLCPLNIIFWTLLVAAESFPPVWLILGMFIVWKELILMHSLGLERMSSEVRRRKSQVIVVQSPFSSPNKSKVQRYATRHHSRFLVCENLNGPKWTINSCLVLLNCDVLNMLVMIHGLKSDFQQRTPVSSVPPTSFISS